jgi:hypothetical protein
MAETKKMIKALVNYAQIMGYENHEDFANFIGKNLIGK